MININYRLWPCIQGFVDGTYENHGFLFKIEESADYVALKAEENTYKDYDTAYRLFRAEEEEEEEENRLLLVVHYVLPIGNGSNGDATADDGTRNDESSATLSVFTSIKKIFICSCNPLGLNTRIAFCTLVD